MDKLEACEHRILELENLLETSERKADVLTSILMEANGEFERALDRIARSEKNFRAVFETVPEPIYLIDANTRFSIAMNSRWIGWDILAMNLFRCPRIP